MNHSTFSLTSICTGTGLLVLFSCTGKQTQPVRRPESPPSIVKPSREEILLNGTEPEIRVALFNRAASGAIQISSGGPLRIETTSGRQVASLPSLSVSPITTVGGKLAIQGQPSFESDTVVLESLKDGDLTVNGIAYHGKLRIRRREDGLVSAVNYVPLDAYLSGVLGSEVILSWPTACLQANSIASRTYALYQMVQSENDEADVMSDTRDQVYRGMERESDRARSIIEQTSGIVLTSSNRLFPAYFSSTCGGHTTDAQTGLNRDGWKPLTAVKCGFCEESRHFRWKFTVQTSEIAAALGRAGHKVGSITDIRIIGRVKDGRATDVEIVHVGGVMKLHATAFRHAMGTGKLRSTLFNVKVSGSNAEFTGNGWGHGVGLCQWGTKGMASAGYTAEFILNRYYPGAKLSKIY